MSLSKEEEVYKKQICILQEKIKRRQESIVQKEKNIKLNRAKCAAVEQETKDIMEYLQYEVAKKERQLAEEEELLKKEAEESRLEMEEIKKKNDQIVQKLEDQLKEMTINLHKTSKEGNDTGRPGETNSVSPRSTRNEKKHQAKMKALRGKGRKLDPEKVASALKRTEEDMERAVKEGFSSAVKAGRAQHQMFRDDLAFLKDVTPGIKQQQDDMHQQQLQTEQNLKDVQQNVEEATTENHKLTKEVQRLQRVTEDLEKEVRELGFSIEDHERKMKREQDRLSKRKAKRSQTCQKQKKEIDRLKTAIEAERGRSTELSMALKEADIIFKHITEEPKMDPQKLRRLHSILEGYAPPHKTF